MANSFSFSNNLDIVWSWKIPRVMGDIAKGIKSFQSWHEKKIEETEEIDDVSSSPEKKKKPKKKSTKRKNN